MNTARCLLNIFGAALLAVGIFIAAITPETLRGNERLRSGDIRSVIDFIEATQQSIDRPPSETEFEEWKAARGWDNRAIFLQTTGSMRSEDCTFGEIPAGSYGVTMWRGEWNECYSGWERAYSFDETLDTNMRAVAVCGSLALLALLISAWLARRQPPNSSFNPTNLRGT